MNTIVLTIADPVNNHYIEVFKKIAKDLLKEYKCEVIVRDIRGVIIHREVYRGKEQERR